MLDETKVLEGQYRAAQQQIEVDPDRMRGEFGYHTGTQAPPALSTVALQVELIDQPAVDRPNDLTEVGDRSGQLGGELPPLVAATRGEQPQVVVAGQQGGHRGPDVAFVAEHGPVGVVRQQLREEGIIVMMSGGQGEVQQQTPLADQQVQLEAVDRLLLRGHHTIVGLAPPAMRRVVKVHHGHRHAIGWLSRHFIHLCCVSEAPSPWGHTRG